jgi:hypothetical protein
LCVFVRRFNGRCGSWVVSAICQMAWQARVGTYAYFQSNPSIATEISRELRSLCFLRTSALGSAAVPKFWLLAEGSSDDEQPYGASGVCRSGRHRCACHLDGSGFPGWALNYLCISASGICAIRPRFTFGAQNGTLAFSSATATTADGYGELVWRRHHQRQPVFNGSAAFLFRRPVWRWGSVHFRPT